MNVEDFLPADESEKQSLVVMRESVGFWKDGMRRLKKNKIAMVSLIVVLVIFVLLLYRRFIHINMNSRLKRA